MSKLDKLLLSPKFAYCIVGSIAVGLVVYHTDPHSITGTVAIAIVFVGASVLAAYGILALLGILGLVIVGLLRQISSSDTS